MSTVTISLLVLVVLVVLCVLFALKRAIARKVELRRAQVCLDNLKFIELEPSFWDEYCVLDPEIVADDDDVTTSRRAERLLHIKEHLYKPPGRRPRTDKYKNKRR